MSGLFSYGSSTTQRTGNDAIYGQGTDGDVTISSSISLTSDKYYNNLTVNASRSIITNGYKIFVKNTLTLNGFITINQGVGATTDGTLHASTASTNVSNVLGGIGAGSSANTAPSWVTENIYGLVLDSSPVQVGGLATVRGGSAGIAGSTGSTTAALTNSDTWSGKAGTAGSAGNYAPNANTVGASGGKGYTGNSGTVTGATAGIGGAGGLGGLGGALVVVVAKNITGTGTILATGFSGSAGSTGSTGNPGTAGNTGATAPTLTVNAGQNSTAVIAGCNNHTSPANTPNCVAHGHVRTNAHENVRTNAHENVRTNAHENVRDGHHHSYCSQHHPNGHCINHAHAQSNHHYHQQNHHHFHQQNHHHYHQQNHAHHSICNAHNTIHANHICNTNSSYAGGAGGAGGAAAPAVTGGTGQAGYNGGGGAIIVITDSTPAEVIYSVAAGTGGTGTGGAGNVYVILNK
jgi:hypothetical protein